MIKIIIGSSNKILGSLLASQSIKGAEFSSNNCRFFSDGELEINLEGSFSGKEVIILQSTGSHNHLVELLLTIDAAHRAGAEKISLIIPYFGYARQDRPFPGQPLSASLIARLIEASGNIKHITTLDLHSPQIAGFFRCPVTNLPSDSIFLTEIKIAQEFSEGLVLVAPDVGSYKKIKPMADILNCPIIIINKHRSGPGVSVVENIIGDPKGKHCLIIDDMIAGGGTIFNAAETLMEKGAKSVVAFVSHGLFVGDCMARMEESKLTKIYVIDSLEKLELIKIEKIKFLSLFPVIKDLICAKLDNKAY